MLPHSTIYQKGPTGDIKRWPNNSNEGYYWSNMTSMGRDAMRNNIGSGKVFLPKKSLLKTTHDFFVSNRARQHVLFA